MHGESEDTRIGFEDECDAVAMVHVEIDDGHTLQSPRLQDARGHCDIVERAEALPVARKRVMKSAADVCRDAEV